jgi:hypothetical protein
MSYFCSRVILPLPTAPASWFCSCLLLLPPGYLSAL